MNAIKYGIIPFVVFLTACAPTPRPAEMPSTDKVIPVEVRQKQTATISSWELSGALAAKNNNKAWSAAMNWVQHGPNAYQIRLIGPLGGGTVLIKKTGKTITFSDGQKSISSTNADELLAQQTGIRLPVNNLYYWVRGLPAPGTAQKEQRDQYNHLVQLKQNGYTIDFARYTSIKGIDVPSVIRLEGNNLMIKIIIKNWSI